MDERIEENIHKFTKSDTDLSFWKETPEQEVHLLYENDESDYPKMFNPDIRTNPRQCSDDSPETTSLWRKLAGVRPQENVEVAKNIPTIMSNILLACGDKFKSNLTVEWSNDNWNSCLMINGAKTNIMYEDLEVAIEGLQHIANSDDAGRIVVEVVLKKIESLFV